MCPPTIRDYDSYRRLTAEFCVMWILIKATIPNLLLLLRLVVTYSMFLWCIAGTPDRSKQVPEPQLHVALAPTLRCIRTHSHTHTHRQGSYAVWKNMKTHGICFSGFRYPWTNATELLPYYENKCICYFPCHLVRNPINMLGYISQLFPGNYHNYH